MPLRKKDSLFIFVEIAPVATAPEAIAEDRILFETPGSTQHVTLFSVVQDAEFFIETKTNPNIIGQNTVWNNNKAKIIFGNLTLAPGKTLTIEKGTQVVFHKNSGLKVSKNATLTINGDLGSEVVFRGTRADRFSNDGNMYPLNWNSIDFDAGSVLTMNYARLFGGTTGLKLDQASAIVKNTIIHSFQEHGILADNSSVTAENVVMNNCGEADFGIYRGGNYKLTHCTLTNYWSMNSALPSLSLFATNQSAKTSAAEAKALALDISNSILYSDKPTAVVFKPIAGQQFNYKVINSLLQIGADAGFAFEGNPSVVNSIKNTDPKFENAFTEKMNLRLKADSPAKGNGNVSAALAVPYDLLKVLRTSSPTIGAYQ